MPELPEVETVRKTLEPVIGARITGAWTSGKGLHMARKPPRAKLTKLVGATITGIRRHGKYLLFDTDRPAGPSGATDRGNTMTILGHLGMTGRFRIVQAGEARVPHTHVVLALADGRELRYIDARRFGQVDVVERAREREHAALAVLGPDPITQGIDVDALYQQAKAKRTTLKAFVLDQSVIAGVGNIYASEALWRAQLKPTLRTNRLTPATTKRLADAVLEVLHRSLENNGTSLRDFVDADGAEGSNWDYLWVYDRLGQACPRCKSGVIRRAVHQGRATYYCPTCQTA